MKCQSGYTLIELLVTLSTLSILLLIPAIMLPNLSNSSHEADLVAQQLKEEIQLAQHVAMSTGRETFVRLDNNAKEFIIRFSIFEVYSITPYQHPDMLVETINLEPSAIAFLPNGHPKRSGSFLLRIGKHRYQYTVYLGKGMVSYKKI
ncbi:competence type IV pilus minor pilin ComGD [Halalkalibacter kiskunsagensis]|uniref:Competence type IV pilus minor pilin ComGD n=1 Tax=Halalkalibacter kiskunsagensis TaxID=1548599 RepID=A0ABV6KCC9_9BACI